MMLVIAAVALIGASVSVAVSWLRARVGSISAWTILSSVAFLNIAFLINVFRRPQDEAAEQGLLVATAGLVMLTLGLLLGRHFGGASPPEESGTHARRTFLTMTPFGITLIAITILGPAWAYFALLGDVPLLTGLRSTLSGGVDGLGGLQAARLSRDGYVTGEGAHVPMQGLFEAFRNVGCPVLFVLALVAMHRGMSRRYCQFLMVLAVLTSMAAGQRWPLMYLAMAAILALGLDRIAAPRRLLARLALVAVLAGATLSALQARSEERITSVVQAVGFGFANLADRIFFQQAQVPIDSYALLPSIRASITEPTYWSSLAAFLPGPGASFSVDFYQMVTGDSYGFTAPPDIYTEAYLNFGAIGLVLLSFVWGLGIGLFDSRFIRVRSEVGCALAAAFGAVLIFSPSSGAVFVVGFVPVALAVWCAAKLTVPQERLPSRRPSQTYRAAVEVGPRGLRR